jgi:hypothetical protein
MFAGLVGGSSTGFSAGAVGTKVGSQLASWLVTSALSGDWNGYALGRAWGTTLAVTAATDPGGLAKAAAAVGAAAAEVANALGGLLAAPLVASGLLADSTAAMALMGKIATGEGVLVTDGGDTFVKDWSFKNAVKRWWNDLMEKGEKATDEFFKGLISTPTPTPGTGPGPDVPTPALAPGDDTASRIADRLQSEIIGLDRDTAIEMARQLRLNFMIKAQDPNWCVTCPGGVQSPTPTPAPPALPTPYNPPAVPTPPAGSPWQS